MRRLLMALGLLCCGTQARAAGVSLRLDRTEASVQDTLTLQVVVEGSQSASASLPDLSAFEVRQGGRSTQMQLLNGRMSTASVSTYYLTPRRPGRLTIDAASVQIDGHTYRSEPLSLVVGTASAAPSEQGPIFVTAELSENAPYLGQQLVYTWRLYRRNSLRISNPALTLPHFEGFATEALGEEREYESMLHGQAYAVTEVRKALFAQDPGVASIDGSSLQCDVLVGQRRGSMDNFFNSPLDDFFGRGQHQRRLLRTPPLPLSVRALPPEPSNFSGLVGETSLTASLSHRSVQVGDATTLTIGVSSNGSPQRLVEPSLGALPNIKIYDDRPTQTSSPRAGGLLSSRVFKKALVPTRGGEVRLQPISLTYFDPASHSYRIARSEPLNFSATGGSRGEDSAAAAAAPATPARARTGVAVLADDIMAPHRSLDALNQGHLGASARAAVRAGLLLPPLLYLGLQLWQRRAAAGRGGRRRRRQALRQALAQASTLAQSQADLGQAAAQASRSLRTYLGTLLGAQGLALTPADARDQLAARGAQAHLAAAVESWLTRCEAMQYGGANTPANAGAMANEMRALLGQLEAKVR